MKILKMRFASLLIFGLMYRDETFLTKVEDIENYGPMMDAIK